VFFKMSFFPVNILLGPAALLFSSELFSLENSY
jgi:hypothetical protein